MPFYRWHVQINSLNQNGCSSIQMSRKFVPDGPIKIVLTLVQKKLGTNHAIIHYLSEW